MIPNGKQAKGRYKPKANKHGEKKVRRGPNGGDWGSPGMVIPKELRRNATDMDARWAPVFPARVLKRLRYSDNFNLAGASGVVASYVFAANGLFDPNITGTGHQPMGFDQLMLSYNHYIVTECRATVLFRNNSGAGCCPQVSIKVDAGSTPSTVVNTILEFGLNDHTVLEAAGTMGANKVLSAAVSIKQFEGVQDVVDNIDFRGSVAANPAEITYFHVQSWDTLGLSTSVQCEVILEYASWFVEPRVLTPSLRSHLMRAVMAEEAKTVKKK
jgi:hypothetical protein